MVIPFNFSRTPRIFFGPGKTREFLSIIDFKNKNILFIAGKSSYNRSLNLLFIINRIETSSSAFYLKNISHEPTPGIIDSIVADFKDKKIDYVIGAGGGSVLDSAKAVSAMLTVEGSVKDYLEGFNDRKIHPGESVPCIAIPTTSGTGSEATKNAVISETGINGFKRSLRHDNFVPIMAVVDPENVITCPSYVTASSGMDALTQLLESYVSTQSNSFTDAIARSGLDYTVHSLEAAYKDGPDIEARSGMAYAALCSGITLAHAGLGTVHGFASSIGSRFPMPHGTICGTLLAVVTEFTIKKLIDIKPDSGALEKYSRVGKLFHQSNNRSDSYYLGYLVSELYRLTDTLNIPRLVEAGFDLKVITQVAAGTSCKNNPVSLTEDELEEIQKRRV